MPVMAVLISISGQHKIDITLRVFSALLDRVWGSRVSVYEELWQWEGSYVYIFDIA